MRSILRKKNNDYREFCEEVVASGQNRPLGIGALIFYEVKVMTKVMLNVKSEKLIGLAVTEKETKGLHNIFKILQSSEPVPAEFVLQFL